MKYFVDAAATGSLKKSAALNFVTHSAVSLAVRALEKDLGVDLLTHEKRKFQLTREGEAVHRRFEAWLREMSEFKAELTATSDRPTGELRLVSAQSLMTTAVYDALLKYRALYPDVRVSIAPGTSRAVHASLVSGDADLGILVDNHLLSGCDSRVIAKGKFLLVKRPGVKRSIDDGVLITSQQKVEVAHLAKAVETKKRKLQIDMQITSWTLIKNLVMKSAAIGYVPDYVVKDELRTKKLVVVPTPGTAFDYEIKAAWKSGRPPHRNVDLFLDVLSS